MTPTPSDTTVVSPVDGAVVALSGVSRSFGGVHALRDAALTITAPGEVHGLIGENGSGKSTLLRILSGQLRPDHGTLTVAGTPATFRSPAAALAAGIVMVSQETAVAPDLSVAENILMGRRLVRGRVGLDWPATRRRAADVLRRLGLDYDVDRAVGTLRADQRQMVEIARAISTDARVVVLDEPTSSLTDDQVEALFAVVRSVSEHGVSVVFVSHRMPELFGITDRITVLRDGRTVLTAATAETSPDEVVNRMVGGVEPVGTAQSTGPRTGGDVALQVRGLRCPGTLDGVDLTVRRGEIVGLAGLAGAGRGELLECLFGLRASTAGSVTVYGAVYDDRSPAASLDRRIGYLPPERRTQGLVLSMSVAANLVMASSRHRVRLARPDRRAESRAVAEATRAMRLRTVSADAPVGALSGGNQQKVALGKWIATRPSLLLLDEPTRGVDVMAKAEIHATLRTAVDGRAMLISSSEPEELLSVCDRVVVLYRGRSVADLPVATATEEQLARYTGGQL